MSERKLLDDVRGGAIGDLVGDDIDSAMSRDTNLESLISSVQGSVERAYLAVKGTKVDANYSHFDKEDQEGILVVEGVKI